MLSPTPRRLGTALLLFSWIVGYARAQSETRVDDDDSDIEYIPPGSWFRNPAVNELDAGGHHMVTEDTAATAVFRFTGTGIRYMSALYALEINTQVRLDGGIPVVINLQDNTVPVDTDGPPTVTSSVLWEARGLANEQHTLEIGFAPGGLYAVVDMFIVETDGAATTDTTETTPTTTTDEETSTSSTTRTRAAAATSPTASPTPATTAALTIIIAVVCSVFGLLFIIGLLLFLARRRRQRREREAWNAMGSGQGEGGVGSPPLDTVDDGISAPVGRRFRSKPSYNGSLSKYYDEGPESMREVGTGGSVGGGTAGRKTPSRLRQVAVASEDGRRESWVPPVLPPKDYGIEETSRT